MTTEGNASVIIERHRQRHGFAGTIRVQQGQSSCDYKVKVINHPHFDDLLSLQEGDWSAFSIQISRGSRRRREIVAEQRGDELDGWTDSDEESPTTTLAARQFLLQAAKVGIDALINLRRETMRAAIRAGTNLTLPNHLTMTVPLPCEAWLQTEVANSAFIGYLLA